MTLAQLIHEFAQLHPEYGDQQRAWGLCDVASLDFIRFCRDRGHMGELKTYTFHTIRKQLHNENGAIMCSWHCIVDAGHILIDFTARQYSLKFAYPHIIAVEEKQLTMAVKAGGL